MTTAAAPKGLLAASNDHLADRLARSQLQTSRALLFHTVDRELQLVTAHPVRASGRRGVPTIGPGRPMLPADERDILDLLMLRTTGAETVVAFPEHLLFRDAHRLAWWSPPHVRPMHLQQTATRKTILTRWPYLAMVFGTCEQPSTTTLELRLCCSPYLIPVSVQDSHTLELIQTPARSASSQDDPTNDTPTRRTL